MRIFKSLLVVLLLLASTQIFSQLSAPDPEAVYGGRINAISVIQTSGATSRVFISTESANSIFYADFTTAGTPVFSPFGIIPGVGDDDGYGSGIRVMAADENSGFLFFIANNNLYSTHPSSSAVNTIFSVGVSGMTIYSGYLFFTENNHVRWGTIDSSTGAFTEDSYSPITLASAMSSSQIAVNTSNLKVYITDLGTSPMMLYLSSSDYNSFDGSTSFATLSTSSLVGSTQWTGFGCGPDGTIMYNGNYGGGKEVAHSTNGGVSWTNTSTGISGVGGFNFAYQLSGADYIVYFAKCYSTFNTTTKSFGSWVEFGNSGLETHPNDGVVAADPVNPSIVYFTTDQGIGATTNGGGTIFEIDDGVEAVQVKDFDMNAANTDAWLAAKSGVRYVSGYGTSPSWSNAIFPNNDGSPYYSAEMVHDNPFSAYVGNLRIYKTQNRGNSWLQVFTAENAPYNFPGIGLRVEAIEVYQSDSNLVACGYTIGDPAEGDSLQGGFFYSTDGGASWNQQLLKAASGYFDADVNDIVFATEGGNPVAYIGVTYDNTISISSRARSVYRAEWSGSSWSIRNDFDGSYTSAGYPITATIIDLYISQSGDTLLACGTDAGTNHPILYYKILSGTGLWTPFTTTGFPASSGRVAKAVSFGNDTVYCAVDNEIYMMHFGGSSWTNGYSYPVGTEINVLYFDDLLVGTGTGIYAQNNSAVSAVNDDKVIFNNPNHFELAQNYPNPFNPATTITFNLPVEAFVQLKVFNVLGEEVKTLLNDKRVSGRYEITFNADDLPSGLYLYRLQSGSFVQTKKMLLLK
ncbi:MAG: T9SS type A sorting domain-containing protein [Ignavibacteriaceae bacterium]|nr:T9SS type A sorting domain-containing protein [Ignavibacteriaceae bacterium]